MRTNIDIDNELLREAMVSTGARTKREVVRQGLETLVQLRNQREALDRVRGKINWVGDLDAMRRD